MTRGFVSSTECPEITQADLSIDQWRPIPFDKFVATLSDSAFYDGEYYIAPESVNLDLENNTNAIVWCTCKEIDHRNDSDVAIMAPELLVLTSFPDERSLERRYLCFVRT